LIQIFNIFKKHWKEILLSLLLMFLMLKSKHDINQMRDSHDAAEQAMMQQIEGLKQIHADEIAEREKALQEYKERVIEIEERYINAQDEIEKLSQEERQEFVRDFSLNKQNLIDAITQRYGFTYVP
tara:strand:- start:2564 stop:2941 length:378 start_codon:yes stop_codon:yes gene_type:complete